MPYLVSLVNENSLVNNVALESFNSYSTALDYFLELHSYRKCGLVTYTLNSKRDFQDMTCDNHKTTRYSNNCILSLVKYETINIPMITLGLQSELISSVVESYNSYLETIAEDHEEYLLYHVDSQNDYKWYMLEDIDSDTINSYLEELGLSVSENILEYLADNAGNFTYVVPYSGYYGSNQSQDATKINVWHIDETEVQLEYDIPQYIGTHNNLWYVSHYDYMVVGINGGIELHIDPNNLLDCIRDYVS